MRYSKYQLQKAHKASYANKSRLKEATQCGCFYCINTFNVNQIEDWSIDMPDDTALCPFCGIDSVIGDNEGFSITEEFLETMYSEYFG